MPKMIVPVVLLCLLNFVVAEQNQLHLTGDMVTADTIHDKLVTSEIIPQVLDDFTPLLYPDLIYRKHATVSLGNNLPLKYVSHRPVFTLTQLGLLEHDPVKTYTLILTDPDATSRDNPKWSEMCHWVLTNITAPFQLNPELEIRDAPAELIKYLAPSPPKKTGAHRYVFVLLEGTSTHLAGPSERKHWGYHKARHGVRDWAAENELKVVGANFFYAQHKKQ